MTGQILREVSIAIPTYGRDQVLVDTVGHLLRQEPPAAEILIVDQTPKHDPPAQDQLARWHAAGAIKWLTLAPPSIPKAMNLALQQARFRIVLFLDDDILPAPDLVLAHEAVYQEARDIWAVAGMVLQPGESPLAQPVTCAQDGMSACLQFPFFSTQRQWVRNVMAGNLSVLRDRALEVGGFDENFVGVAYRFETEFCRRLWQQGGRVLFEPAACIRHLRAARGGTRQYGCHLTSASPAHGVGDYYFALRQGASMEALCYMAKRPIREVCTRFHLRHPWWIPVKLFGEIRAMWLALCLHRYGPAYTVTPPALTSKLSVSEF